MGTGEGEGENRALEAAERAIANPLLDGVSMQGAKGVIISIIGGEDMRLLEVDEAANHIRELVDEDANIIWGSAFNPELEGKIRVSVVATGIEQGAVGSIGDSAPVSLGAARPPKRPVLEFPQDEPAPEPVVEEEPFELQAEAPPAIEPEAELEATEPETEAAEPFDLSGMQAGDDYEEDEDFDDVDGIVDPLAGLRNAQNDPYADDFGGGEEPVDDSAYGEPEPVEEAVEPLDLTAELGAEGAQQAEGAGQSEPQDYDDYPDQQPIGGRRRSLLGGGAADADDGTEGVGGEAGAGGGGGDAGAGSGGGGGSSGGEESPAPVGGSTLFERMANLSRGANAVGDEEDDEELDDEEANSPSLSIPRFLGRQNNQ